MKTKAAVLLFAAVIFSSVVSAGMVGWFTSEARDWQFIQQSGGVRIVAPIERNGRKVLPVDYWPEGNSGLAVRKIDLKKKGDQIVIVIFTQLVEKGSDTARTRYVDLAGIALGTHAVYYETAGDPAKLLGRIDIK